MTDDRRREETANTPAKRVAVIMAGGSGERFWPLSRLNRPKQLLHLTSPTETMLREAVARIAPMIPPEHTYVQTAEHLVTPIREANVGVPPENVIAEPCKRNTAGCLAYAAAHLIAKYGAGANLSMAVLTADHVIGEPQCFLDSVEAALEAAEKDDVVVTIGIVPTRPATGFGYIQAGTAEAAPGNEDRPAVLPVQAFHEKPDRERAQQYLEDGAYYWNSGMFFWRISTFLAELDTASPSLAKATRAIADAMAASDDNEVRRIFDGLEDISIDYALMEKARRVAVVRATFPWDDIGAWAALERTRTPDEQGNVTHGDPVLIDCKDSIIFNADGAENMAVGVVGAENLTVVVTRDAVLVVPKDRTEDVKKIVQALRERNARQL